MSFNLKTERKNNIIKILSPIQEENEIEMIQRICSSQRGVTQPFPFIVKKNVQTKKDGGSVPLNDLSF